ncbi:serine/threonine-protein kinase DCLK1-like protein [Turdus rufiventris]|nr:serine/threonine-protein kinase DCLK1-like protein [Turdus rufiventris]
MGCAGAMSDGDVPMIALVLLLATVAVYWALGHWQPRRRQKRTLKCSKHPAVWPRGSQRKAGAPVAPGSSRPRANPRKRPRAPANPLGSPCSCNPLVTVAQELQDLMLLLWDRNGARVPLYSGMWQALWRELQELVKRGHLGRCGSSGSTGGSHPLERPQSTTARASALARMAQQQRPTIHAGASGCQRPSILPAASALSDSLHPLQRLGETCQPVEGAEPLDRSPSSLGLMGTTLTVDVARESPEVQMGAQPEPGEPSQELLAEQQVSWSQQLPAHSCQDAMLGVAAGHSPSLEVEMTLETPREFLHLQEAAPREPSSTTKGSLIAGPKKQLQELYQLGLQLGSGGFGRLVVFGFPCM